MIRKYLLELVAGMTRYVKGGRKVGESLRILWREEVEATAVGLLQSLGKDWGS